MIPFLVLGGLAGWLALQGGKVQQRKEIEKVAAEAETAKPAPEPPITDALKMDDLRIELGYALLPLINAESTTGDQLTEQIKALRRQLAFDLGVLMPPVRILDNVQLGANEYVIKVKEVEVGKGEIQANQSMVMDPQGKQVKLPGTHRPSACLRRGWIPPWAKMRR